MANPPADLYPKESRVDRLRRELRNPSMLTVTIITVLILAIPLAIFLPGWVSTAQDSFRERSETEQRSEDSRLSIDEIVPAQVAPWMVSHINRLLVADSPADWTLVSFDNGACHQSNLAQLPPGKYSAAIVQACADMLSIQDRYAAECPDVPRCNFSAESKTALEGVKTYIYAEFADTNFVLPYTSEEQPVGP